MKIGDKVRCPKGKPEIAKVIYEVVELDLEAGSVSCKVHSFEGEFPNELKVGNKPADKYTFKIGDLEIIDES